MTRATALRSLAAVTLGALLSSPAWAQSPPPSPTIVELAAQDKNLSTFSTALHATGLDESLKGEGPYTVFAPTDDAFAKLPASDRAMLMADPARMRLMLLGHIVNGVTLVHPTPGTVTRATLPTDDGGTLSLSGTPDRPTVGGAGVVKADVRAGNGVLTTLDRVVLP
ncbi:MAG TPA: fasciclin domain-containing protein [Candidatus Elarobacter sp.]|nr:fasciclin domain-containing protein [Candidatus Elarobacter sp.]